MSVRVCVHAEEWPPFKINCSPVSWHPPAAFHMINPLEVGIFLFCSFRSVCCLRHIMSRLVCCAEVKASSMKWQHICRTYNVEIMLLGKKYYALGSGDCKSCSKIELTYMLGCIIPVSCVHHQMVFSWRSYHVRAHNFQAFRRLRDGWAWICAVYGKGKYRDSKPARMTSSQDYIFTIQKERHWR